MTRVRDLLGLVAAAWLSCQLGTLALTPFLSFAGPDTQATECTCTHGADAVCPMHQKATPGSNGSKICVMQSLNDRAAVVLASIVGLTGPLPEAVSHGDLMAFAAVAMVDSSLSVTRPIPPDPPPPRP